MARKSLKAVALATQLIYALARVNELTELTDLLAVPTGAEIDQRAYGW